MVVAAEELLSFLWFVHAAGYVWQDYRGEAALLPAEPPSQELEGWRYLDPLAEEPELYLKLAAVVPEQLDQMLAFANTYGPLGVGEDRQCQSDDDAYGPAERLFHWQYHIRALAAAVDIWRLWQAGDGAGLEQKYLNRVETRVTDQEGHWVVRPIWGTRRESPAPVQVAYSYPAQSAATRAEIQPAFFSEPDTVLAAAARDLANRVNEATTGHVRYDLVYDHPTRSHLLAARPVSLLGGLWLQLARAIASKCILRECASCANWFTVNPADKRQGRRRFCSDLCKLRDYRTRKAETAELAAQGLKPAEIARRTGTDLTTVKKWLGKPNKGE